MRRQVLGTRPRSRLCPAVGPSALGTEPPLGPLGCCAALPASRCDLRLAPAPPIPSTPGLGVSTSVCR